MYSIKKYLRRSDFLEIFEKFQFVFSGFWPFWAVFSTRDLKNRPPDTFFHRFGPIFIEIRWLWPILVISFWPRYFFIRDMLYSSAPSIIFLLAFISLVSCIDFVDFPGTPVTLRPVSGQARICFECKKSMKIKIQRESNSSIIQMIWCFNPVRCVLISCLKILGNFQKFSKIDFPVFWRF